MAAGPGAASAPGHRAEGAPPRVLRYPRALPAPPRCPCYGVPGALWGQRCEGPRGSLRRVRGARGEAAPSGDGAGGSPCSWKSNDHVFGYLRGRSWRRRRSSFER